MWDNVGCGFYGFAPSLVVHPVFVWPGRLLELHQQRQKTQGFEQIHITRSRGTPWSAEASFSLEC